jgi:AAA family ATP:ADP antiporter
MLGIVRALWGDMSGEEAKKFGFLGIILMFILGNYWMLRVMKNAVFKMFVDFQTYQPWAKVLSLCVIAVLVLIYSKLVDLFKKDQLFYILCTFFGIWVLVMGYLIGHPDLVAVNPGSTLYPLVSWIPGREIGWITYLTFEAITFVIILFWTFVASTTKAESAKKGYGLILFITQLGTVGASLFVARYVKVLGLPNIIMLGGCIILFVGFLVKLYMSVIPHDDVVVEKKKAKTGSFEGLRLLATKPYVMGVFVVSTMYEVVGTILEFQMNSLGAIIYPIAADFAAFNAKYGFGINVLALTFALVGTSFLMRKFGLRFCLVAFPTVIAFVVGSILIFSNFGGASNYQLMWALFAGMIAIKGLSYSLNNPSKEVMYIPTSKDVKFKAKGWIDLFGNRSTKASGAGINIMFKASLSRLLLFGSVISLGLVGVWIVVAFFVGNKFNDLQKDNTIVE